MVGNSFELMVNPSEQVVDVPGRAALVVLGRLVRLGESMHNCMWLIDEG
jgi:hypothetical protein